MAQYNQLFRAVGCRHPHATLFGEFIRGPLNVGVGGFGLLGVDDVNVVVAFMGAGIALDLVGVEYHNHNAVPHGLIVTQQVAKNLAGGVEVL